MGVLSQHSFPQPKGWETDDASLFQLLNFDCYKQCSILRSDYDHTHVGLCDYENQHVFSLPGAQPEVLCTLDAPRWKPEPDLEDNTSNTSRRLPGSIPDEYLGLHSRRLTTLTAGEPYNIADIDIKLYAQMITAFWPDVSQLTKDEFPQFTHDYNEIKARALPNFLGAKVPVKSDLIIESWKKYLVNYHDQYLCDFLLYGWPLGYIAATPPESSSVNHPSAKAHQPHVKKYIETELKHGALLGPFSSKPFQQWTRISPLMTRSKKDSNERRIIVDLSFPAGSAVNDGINPKNHLGKDISYTLPTIMDLVTQIQSQGPACLLWKADLTRAYRQLRSDPVDAPLLGIQVGSDIYLDRCPPFGCRSSASICQRVANAIVYIMAKENHYVIAYLDDFGGCHASHLKAQITFDRFKGLAAELGLQLADRKCCPPATSMDWLGYKVDTVSMSVTIPPAKLHEILHECKQWLHRRHATKKMIQQIAGKLIFLCNCVQQGRKFMARILATLRDMQDRKWATINDQFRADISWFCKYAEKANGIYLCNPDKKQVELECDSSLQGAGGNNDDHYYIWIYSEQHKTAYPQIYQLEAINIVVAYKTLTISYTDRPTHVTIWTDNITSSFALQTGRTKDPILAACARELWLHASKRNQTVEIRHKKGSLLILPDALSRTSFDQTKVQLAQQIIVQRSLLPLPPCLNDYEFFDPAI